MRRSKLFGLLVSFDKQDWKDFDSFLKGLTSPDSELYLTYSYIAHYKDNLESSRLDIEIALDKLFPGKSRKNFQNLLSRLHSEVHNYFIYKQVNEDPIARDLLALKSYQKRGLYTLADKIAKDLVSYIEHGPIDLDNSRHLNAIHHELYFSDNPIKYRKEGVQLMQRCASTLQSTYNEMSALYKFEMENRVLNGAPEFGKVKLLWQKNELSHNWSLLEFIDHISRIRLLRSEESFEYVYHTLLNSNDWSKTLKVIASIICVRHLNYRIEKGELNALVMIFELHKKSVEMDYFLAEGSVSNIRFLNVVQSACAVREINWSKSFINQFSIYLPSNTAEEQLKICNALILIAEKKWSEALDLINQLSATSLKNRWTARFLSLKIYYEIFRENDDESFILSQITNFKEFLKRNKKHISEINRNASKNFLRLVALLVGNESHDNLLKAYLETSVLIQRHWLLEKIEEKK